MMFKKLKMLDLSKPTIVDSNQREFTCGPIAFLFKGCSISSDLTMFAQHIYFQKCSIEVHDDLL